MLALRWSVKRWLTPHRDAPLTVVEKVEEINMRKQPATKLSLSVPAAQYVRMSTDNQQYSIANQKAAILKYAEGHGYLLTSTYADAGKSGLEIKHRKELRRLLADVMGGQAQFKVILVYDVSRWGRFQDVDEAAHYEFLCKSAGVPVFYCAEQFDNDGSPASSIMKALKRTMAAEYSRELGVKTFAGQRRLALLGYWVAGSAGYGLRRMMVSPDGRRRLILKEGERKAIQTDRTILVPGAKREVECIQAMFQIAASRKTPREVAKELNLRQMHLLNGQPWTGASVYRILVNDKYAGCNTYGKTTQTLGSRSRNVGPNLWATNPTAFVSIVDRDVFDHVQKLIKKRGGHPERTDEYFVQGMKRVLAREGRLTKRILERKFTFSHSYYRRFGSVIKAYQLAGFTPPPAIVKLVDTQNRIRHLRNDFYTRLKDLFSDRIRFISLPGQQFRQIAEIDCRIRVAIYLCRALTKTRAGESRWLLRVRPLEKEFPALICTVDESSSELLNFYLFPHFKGGPKKYKQFRANHPWLTAGRQLAKLDEFCDLATEAAVLSQNGDRYTAVDDILIANDTCMILLGKREITLGPIGSGILKILTSHPNEGVSRARLQLSVSETLRDPHNLRSRIAKLRAKLGPQVGRRIQTIQGMGYMYVSAAKNAELGSELTPASQFYSRSHLRHFLGTSL
jgi:DNA invertase Pin-like site-specific DNA recombinase/DNA-binding winged helix-turn-helix (wHTH) protein